MNKKKDKRSEFLELVPGNTKELLDVACGNGGAFSKARGKGE